MDPSDDSSAEEEQIPDETQSDQNESIEDIINDASNNVSNDIINNTVNNTVNEPPAKKSSSSGLALILMVMVVLALIVLIAILAANAAGKRRQEQSAVPGYGQTVETHQRHATFSQIGVIRTTTGDPVPHSVSVDISLVYESANPNAENELYEKLVELRDFFRTYFMSRSVADLGEHNQNALKEDVMRMLNSRILTYAKITGVNFSHFSVTRMD